MNKEINSAASSFQSYVDKAVEMGMEHGPKIIMAFLLLFVGFRYVNKISALVSKRMTSKNVDKSVSSFLKSLVSAAMKVLLIIVVASMLGIETTSLVAAVGAITLAVGMALQGSLANFAGGMMILVFKPYKVGDVVEIQGFWGVVEEIQVFKTTIVAVDRKIHIIPNGVASNGNITNYSAKGILRVDLKAWVGYDEDIEKAKKVALDILEAHPLVVSDPKPRTRVFQLEKDGVQLGIHPYCETMVLWDVYFEVQESIVTEFKKHGISMARPKLDLFVGESQVKNDLKSLIS